MTPPATFTILEALKGVNAYPVPPMTLHGIITRRGLSGDAEATRDALAAPAALLAKADVLMWLSLAPNVTQGGQSYTFSADERQLMRRQAAALYAQAGEDESEAGIVAYGYKGSRL